MSEAKDKLDELISYNRTEERIVSSEYLSGQNDLEYVVDLYLGYREHLMKGVQALKSAITEPYDHEMIISQVEYQTLINVYRAWSQLRVEGVISDDNAERALKEKDLTDE